MVMINQTREKYSVLPISYNCCNKKKTAKNYLNLQKINILA